MSDFKEVEERMLAFWEENDVFQKSIKQRHDQGGKPFVFYEGPPTANASPAIHHFIGRAFKDVIPRYQTMRGRYVLRKGGWDTHGLPVEIQVEKELGFKSKKDIEAFGIAAFNAKCRESVWKFKEEWEQFTRRIGYWVDLQHPYITYENPYIESLWNIISRVWDKKLLYRAHRVVPFCTRCGTPLSSHEVALGYKKVTDNSVYLKFRVKSSKIPLPENTFILAWTTTPWTLPGNIALAVGRDINYILATTKDSDEHYILAEDLVASVLGTSVTVEQQFSGSKLTGTSYVPLFAVKALKSPKSYKVYEADFVSTTEGTGIVHTAVMYGEDDYQLGTKLGLVKKHTVDEQGKFFGVSGELDGKYVKAADTESLILEHLKTDGTLLNTVPYEHEYPFCWRCETPLLYYAKDSWFIRMSAVNAKLLSNNDTINWVPEHLKNGRFGQWIREGKDWAFSRERYWGTPLPIWSARDARGHLTGSPLVVSSLEDLDTYNARKGNTYWLMRHGESTKNVAQTIDSGTGESPLTEKGRQQVIDAAKAFKKKLGKTKLDYLISSPILRAMQTAGIIGRELGIKKILTDDRLKEIQLGPTLDGCHSSKYWEAYPTYQDKFMRRPPGGESLTDLRARSWQVLKELEEKYHGKQIMLVSHEFPIWMQADAANGWTMEQSINEKEHRKVKWNYIGFAEIEKVIVRNLPRNPAGTVDLHRPFIDDIVLKRPNSTVKLYRVPEIADVWFDSGCMPYAQWHWPFENKKIFEQQYPADFISEGIDQTRGWFYTLLAVSTLMGDGAPYRNVLSYSHVLDEKGQKMSKSKGNVVKPDDVIGAVGVDAARWYFYSVNNPGDSKQFSIKDVRERLTGFLGTLQNCVRFWELYAEAPGSRNFSLADRPAHLLDRWALSRLHRVAAETTTHLDTYDLTAAARGIERFVVDDLSQWWLRRSRKRSDSLGLLRYMLLELDKLLAPFIPFTAEDMHMRLHAGTLSVHMNDWPAANVTFIDDALETQMVLVRNFITEGLAARKSEQIKVRQPLASVTVSGTQLQDDLEELIRDELNVKKVLYGSGPGVTLDVHIGETLRAEGYAREVMRTIQDMRKEAGCEVTDRVYCQWFSEDAEVSAALSELSDSIVRETGLSAFVRQPDDRTLTKEKNFELAPGKPLWIGIRI